MKNLLLVLSLVITASPAFASRARLESLGENANGSYYINDGRNIFLNPASINNYKKKLFLELGNSTSVADSSTSGGAATPGALVASGSKVQGGFTNTFGDFVYGLYVGRESNRMLDAIATSNALITGTANDLIAPDHAFDFFFGGEASNLKYGVDVFYAGAQNRLSNGGTFLNTIGQTSSLFGIKLGVDVSNFAVFTTIGITSNALSDAQAPALRNELKGKISVDAAVTYTMDDMTLLGKYTTYGSDLTLGTTLPATYVGKTTAWGIGAGWKKEATKSVTMYSRLQFDYQKNTTDTTASGGTTSTQTDNQSWVNLPIVLAAEAQATSWMTVRGAVSHSLYGQHTNESDKDSMNNMTTVAAGLGFNFGDLNIDALFGQSAAVAGAASEASQGTSQAGSIFGFGDNMLSRISMTYNF